MEERAVGGKEKKYVLYTVVNDDKGRTGCSIWAVRILLGALLLVALAVVPYVSLLLAQQNDRTLVVFQPVPFHNRSRGHHYNHDTHGGSHSLTSRHPDNLPEMELMKSASLVLENYTATTALKNKTSTNSMHNASVVTLHESAVTLSLLEDTNNATQSLKNQSDAIIKEELEEKEETDVTDSSAINFSSSTTSPAMKPEETNVEPEMEIKSNVVEQSNETQIKRNGSSLVSLSVSEKIIVLNNISVTPTMSTPSTPKVIQGTNISVGSVEKFLVSSKVNPVTTSSSQITTTTTTTRPITKFSSTKNGKVSHKLAFVASASSGNHVGGLCVWKTNKNVTKWSFFYDNIPIEFQSHQDNTDHEMRSILVAIRLWSDQWHDYHVVLRSHHPSIKGSKHPTRQHLIKELDQMSEDHFTYEMEWRLGKDDSLVRIAYCLARLHKGYDYWFKKFQTHIDEMLGEQDWATIKSSNRVMVPQGFFGTPNKPLQDDEIGDLTSLSLY